MGVQFIQKVSRAEDIILFIVNLLIPELPDDPEERAENPLSQGAGFPEDFLMLTRNEGTIQSGQR